MSVNYSLIALSGDAGSPARGQGVSLANGSIVMSRGLFQTIRGRGVRVPSA